MKVYLEVLSASGDRMSEVPYVSGDDVKAWRKRIGVSQEWLAHHLGRSAVTIRRWDKLGAGAIPDVPAARWLAILLAGEVQTGRTPTSSTIERRLYVDRERFIRLPD